VGFSLPSQKDYTAAQVNIKKQNPVSQTSNTTNYTNINPVTKKHPINQHTSKNPITYTKAIYIQTNKKKKTNLYTKPSKEKQKKPNKPT
jgi:hypothetical protein